MTDSIAALQSKANPQQLDAILATDGPVLIIAGPGSGKTFTLVERIVYLITEKGVAPESLLVVMKQQSLGLGHSNKRTHRQKFLGET